MIQFGTIFSVFLFSFSGAFYLALRGEARGQEGNGYMDRNLTSLENGSMAISEGVMNTSLDNYPFETSYVPLQVILSNGHASLFIVIQWNLFSMVHWNKSDDWRCYHCWPLFWAKWISVSLPAMFSYWTTWLVMMKLLLQWWTLIQVSWTQVVWSHNLCYIPVFGDSCSPQSADCSNVRHLWKCPAGCTEVSCYQ